MFYNTGIATYIWIISNHKPEHRKGKVQLIDATQWFKPLRKNLGKKNCELADKDIRRICKTFLGFKESEQSKIFPNTAFGYWKVTMERPLRLAGIDPNRSYSPKEIKALKELAKRDETALPVIRKIHKKGTAADPLRGLFVATINGKPALVEYEPDGDLRDTEQIPLLLREYRTRLIADVVTGKLDVREAAVELPDEAEELVDEGDTMSAVNDEAVHDLDTVQEEVEA